jgi:hypothetical protein
LGAQEKRVIEQDVLIAGICLLDIVFGAVVFTSAENICALNQEFSQPKDMRQGSKIHIWLHLILSSIVEECMIWNHQILQRKVNLK